MKLNKIKTFLRNKRGFSMVQVLVVASMLGGLSMLMMRQIQMANVNTRTLEVNIALNQLQQKILTVISRPDSCTATIDNESTIINSVLTSVDLNVYTDLPTNFTIYNNTAGGNVPVITAQDIIDRKVSLDSARIAKMSDNELNLNVTLRRHGKFVGPETVERNYSIFVDTSKNPVECTGATNNSGGDLASFCSSLGGTYNATTSECDGVTAGGTTGDLSAFCSSLGGTFNPTTSQCTGVTLTTGGTPTTSTTGGSTSGGVSNVTCSPGEVIFSIQNGVPECKNAEVALSEGYKDTLEYGQTIGTGIGPDVNGIFKCPAGSAISKITKANNGWITSIDCKQIIAIGDDGVDSLLTDFSTSSEYVMSIDHMNVSQLDGEFGQWVVCPQGHGISEIKMDAAKWGNFVRCRKLRFGGHITDKTVMMVGAIAQCPSNRPTLMGVFIGKTKNATTYSTTLDFRGDMVCAVSRAMSLMIK